MDFQDALQKWTPREIADALGCPLRTAYKWRDGERVPPDWLCRLILAHLKKSKKPNK
jgi:hypothetical protein